MSIGKTSEDWLNTALAALDTAVASAFGLQADSTDDKPLAHSLVLNALRETVRPRHGGLRLPNSLVQFSQTGHLVLVGGAHLINRTVPEVGHQPAGFDSILPQRCGSALIGQRPKCP